MNPPLELHENPSLSRPLRRDEELAAMQPRVSSFQYSCCSSPYSSGHLRKWRIYPVYTQKQLDSLRKNDDEVDLLRKKTTQMGVCFFKVVSMQQIWKQMISQSIYRYSIFQTNPYWWAVSWYVILLGGWKPRFPRNETKRAAAMSSSLDADSLKNWLHLTIRNPWPHLRDPLGLLTYSITCLLVQRFKDFHLTTNSLWQDSWRIHGAIDVAPWIPSRKSPVRLVKPP